MQDGSELEWSEGERLLFPYSLFSVALKSNLNKSELGETFCLVSDMEQFAYDICNLLSLLILLLQSSNLSLLSYAFRIPVSYCFESKIVHALRYYENTIIYAQN